MLDLRRGSAWPEWFVVRLDLAHNALTRHLPARPDQPGIVSENAQPEVRRLLFTELEDEVARGALWTHAIQRGERVGLTLPMIAEAAITVLAAAETGAVTLPT